MKKILETQIREGRSLDWRERESVKSSESDFDVDDGVSLLRRSAALRPEVLVQLR